MEIRKVLKRKDGIKYLIVPKASDIEGGDYVMINKIDENEKGVLIKKNGRKGKKGN